MTLLIVFLIRCLSAQTPLDKYVRANNAITQMSSGNLMQQSDLIYQVRSSYKSEVVGDSYLSKSFGRSSIFLANGKMLEGFLTRYNIQSDEFEFKLQGGLKFMKGTNVKNMVWVDSLDHSTRYLVDARDFYRRGVPLTGFLEVLVEGEVPLMKRILIETIRPNYNMALDVGSKDFTIVKTEKFFFAIKTELIEAKKRTTKKALLHLSIEVEDFCERESINWNKQSDLVRLFQYINSN